ncbi:uncharacterized protein LOC129769519 [Toxorhynchites rutilus septentrionalis]|uniref:uncharacterized protein LOC129769519 n=1 Tax=Toxorhynchites rutilus septentrionalis TaxID=329112 RepID=UPI002479911E|nr:uncharacterized protein LOC129769519 [Toxorhynchites rutilus septentrionalis]
MVKPAARIVIKFLELLGCVACIITKIITDHESRRVFVRNQKLSREWSLIHNITWSSGGNAFTNIVYGGYTIVIALMLITRCVDAKSRPTLFEKIILSLGTLMFFATGGLVFASIDQVHPDLHDNAIILGCLSFLVAILFIFDLADPMARMTAHMTQTEGSTVAKVSQATETEKDMLKKDVAADVDAAAVYSISQDRYRDMVGPERQSLHDIQGNDYQNHYGRGEPDKRSYRARPDSRHQSNFDRHDPERRSTESIVERKVLPSVQVPVFSYIRGPEESRRIAGKEIQYLPGPDYRDRREYRDAGPYTSRQSLHPHSSPKAASYHDNESFVDEISPSRRSTYVPADKYDSEAVQIKPRFSRPAPPAKPTTVPLAHQGSASESSCSNCHCSQRGAPPKRNGQQQQPRDEPDTPIRPGYVANAARKWDERLRSKSQPIIGLNTMV